jgi:type II secretory pathway pseudopilin PulG
MAMAVFAVVLGGTAQALISYYASMEMQEQRVEATEHCRAVLAEMRALRDANPEDFPAAVVETFPDGGRVDWAADLANERVTVAYTDSDANPLEVVVTSMWNDLQGRPVQVRVATALTNE